MKLVNLKLQLPRAVDAIKVIKRDQDTQVGERIDNSGGCSKVSLRGVEDKGTPVDPRIGPFRSISRRLMPASRKGGIGYPASGRSQRHARGRKSAPPFLRTRHPFSPDDSPLRGDHRS